jgi:hypothetical protein
MAMTKSSERRLVENEVIFRQHNEKVQQDLEALRDEAKTEGHDILPREDMSVHFYCECAKETCHERIVLTPDEYKEFHQNSSQFIVLPGHNFPEVERIVLTNDKLMVVEKYITPPPTASQLNPT